MMFSPRRSGWDRRLAALAAVGAVVGTAVLASYAGRATDDSDAPRERSPERPLAALAGLDEDVLLDPAILDEPDALSGLLLNNTEAVVAECMAEAGLQYLPVPDNGAEGRHPSHKRTTTTT